MIGLSAGKISPGPSMSWWPQTASYAVDFVLDRYMKDGVEVTAAAALALSRASSKLAPDQAGQYHAFAAHEMARTDRGLWLEPASTNQIRNNANIGAVVGSTTLPTYWSVTTSAGLSRSVAGIGTIAGIPYLDLRLYGTASSAGPYQLVLEASSFIASVQGDTWRLSAFLQMLDAAAPPLSIRLRLRENNASGTNHAVRDAIVTPSSAIGQLSGAFTMLSAGTAFAQPALAFSLTTGAVYDFTVRIGAPCLEAGTNLSTPVVTSGATATRLQDDLTLALPSVAHTVYLDYEDGSQTIPSVSGAAAPVTIGGVTRTLRKISAIRTP